MKVRAVIIFFIFLLGQFASVSGFPSSDMTDARYLHTNENSAISASFVSEEGSEGIFSRTISNHFLIGYCLPLPVNFSFYQLHKPPLILVNEIGRHLQLCVLRN